MRKALMVLAGILLFSKSYAMDVSLVQYDSHIYMMEVTNRSSKDSSTSLLKKIAKEVHKRGHKYFLLPSNDKWAANGTYIVVYDDMYDSLRNSAESKDWTVWGVDQVLKS